LKPFFVDLDCLFTLEHVGYGIRSVLPAGESITVKTATNYNGPDQSESVPPPYPEGFVGPARWAAAALGVRLAGVDVLGGVGGDPVILEVNPTPGLTHHYNVANAARASRIAVPILAKLLQASAAEPARGP
jgi:D-alanine-D-alanine ligase-like ATP-grasp enzyme